MASAGTVLCVVHSLGLVLVCAGVCSGMTRMTSWEDTARRDAAQSPTESTRGQGEFPDSGAAGLSRAKSESGRSVPISRYLGKFKTVNLPRSGHGISLRCPVSRCCRALRATRSAREERWSCRSSAAAAAHSGVSGNQRAGPSITWWRRSTDQQRPWTEELGNQCKGRYSGDCLSANERGAVYACVITFGSGRDGPRTCHPYFFRVRKPVVAAATAARQSGCYGNSTCSTPSLPPASPSSVDPDRIDASTSSPPPFPATATPRLAHSVTETSAAHDHERDPAATTVTATTRSARLQDDVMAAQAPLFTNPPLAMVLAPRGAALALDCSATGHPTPAISWLRGYTALGSDQNTRVAVRPNGSLHFTSVSRRDEGVYRCVAENKHGQVVSRTNLYVP